MAAQIGAPAAAIRAHEELFAYWSSRRRGGGLPARADIHPGGFKRLLPTVSLIDVIPQGPCRAPDYRIRLAGTALYNVYGREITGRGLGEVYNSAAADYWRAELDKVVLPRKTLANRRKVGTLTAEQSDRLLRVARVVAMAEETFGNQQKAAAWLRRPTSPLAGERPLDLLDTDEGAREVETLLGRIAHGIAA